MKESRIQAEIIAYIESLGGWVLNVAGGPEIKRGTPDLLASIGGRFWAIEVKRPGEKPEAIQLRRLRQIARSGGLVFLWDSLGQATSEAKEAVEYGGLAETPGSLAYLLRKMASKA